MEASLRALAERGFTSTILWVLDTNQQAIDFYTGRGFSQDGKTKEEQWGEFTISEIRMVRP